MSMKVILLQDIDKLGKKFEVKEVKDGHARNLLIPKGLVKQATKEAMEWLEVQKEILEKQAEEGLKTVQELASKLEGQEISIAVKVGDQDKLFESINAVKIAETLKEAGFNIKKSQVDLKEPIKEIGEYPIKIKLEHNLEAEIHLVVIKEKEE